MASRMVTGGEKATVRNRYHNPWYLIVSTTHLLPSRITVKVRNSGTVATALRIFLQPSLARRAEDCEASVHSILDVANVK